MNYEWGFAAQKNKVEQRQIIHNSLRFPYFSKRADRVIRPLGFLTKSLYFYRTYAIGLKYKKQ
jgi:hypothetical protein